MDNRKQFLGLVSYPGAHVHDSEAVGALCVSSTAQARVSSQWVLPSQDHDSCMRRARCALSIHVCISSNTLACDLEHRIITLLTSPMWPHTHTHTHTGVEDPWL
jgi:hypothetical protein